MAPHQLGSNPTDGALRATEPEKTTGTSPKPNYGTPTAQELRIPKSADSSSDDLSSLGKRDIIIFSDFDGTIFMQDTGHILFDTVGCGADRREELDEQIRIGARSFRDVSEEMWSSLKVPFDNGFDVMKGALKIDPHFLEFHDFCIKNNIPFNVISAGLKPVLRRVLDEFLGKKQSKFIDIIANDATISDDGRVWKPIWRHDTPLGHDKAASIQEYRTIASSESEDGSCPLIIFVGGGLSDLAAAREADVLFARRGQRLEEYCSESKISHIPFDTFRDDRTEIIRIMKEDTKKTAGAGKPAQYNPRANFWRKIVKRKNVRHFVKNSTMEDKMRLWPEAFTAAVKQDAQIDVVPPKRNASSSPPRRKASSPKRSSPPRTETKPTVAAKDPNAMDEN